MRGSRSRSWESREFRRVESCSINRSRDASSMERCPLSLFTLFSSAGGSASISSRRAFRRSVTHLSHRVLRNFLATVTCRLIFAARPSCRSRRHRRSLDCSLMTHNRAALDDFGRGTHRSSGSFRWLASCATHLKGSSRGEASSMVSKTPSVDQKRREMLREMLVRTRDETYQRIQEIRAEQEQESDIAPGDEMDAARAAADFETHAGLIANAELRLKDLDDALARLGEGRYGVCADCNQPIPVERLIAVPFALYCVKCEAKRPA